MTDDVLSLRSIKQPLRALLYEKLVWKHLLGFGIKQCNGAEEGEIRTVSYHENGNIRTMLGVIGFLVIVEGIAIDFFVATKSTKLAILLGAVHVMMLLYTVALMRAAKQRPTLVTPNGLLVRTSLLYCCWLPMESIQSLSGLEKEIERVNSPHVLWCALGDQPNVVIELSKAEEAVLPFGLVRRPNRLYVYVDQPTVLVNDVSRLRGQS